MTLECSWCDAFYKVCTFAAEAIRSKEDPYGLCAECLGAERGRSGSKARNPDRKDNFETSGPWQDNAIRHLEGD